MSSVNNAQRVFLSLMSFILPPLPIFILKGYDVFNKEILVSVILTLLGHLPGVIFSLYYIFVLYNEMEGLGTSDFNSSGYTRLNDDDELQVSSLSHNNLGISNVARPELSEEVNDEPPEYEAIADTTRNETRTDQKVFNDNKVQQ